MKSHLLYLCRVKMVRGRARIYSIHSTSAFNSNPMKCTFNVTDKCKEITSFQETSQVQRLSQHPLICNRKVLSCYYKVKFFSLVLFYYSLSSEVYLIFVNNIANTGGRDRESWKPSIIILLFQVKTLYLPGNLFISGALFYDCINICPYRNEWWQINVCDARHPSVVVTRQGSIGQSQDIMIQFMFPTRLCEIKFSRHDGIYYFDRAPNRTISSRKI